MDVPDRGRADRPPRPVATSSLAGSWLESEALTACASRPPARGAAGAFHDDADHHLLVVADGGARQARTCVEILAEEFRGSTEPIQQRLRRAAARVSGCLHDESGAESLGSGVAMAALALAPMPEPGAWWLRVGRYCAYRLRSGQLVALGSNAEAPTGAGLGPAAGVEIEAVGFAPGDRFLLCSHALSAALPEARIAAALRLSSPSVIAHVLENQARKAGAGDEFSAQVVATYPPVEIGAQRGPDPDCAPEGSAGQAVPRPDAREGGVAGFGPPRLESVDLASVLDSELPERRSAMRERSLVVLKELDGQAPPVLADERQIRRIVRALLDEAMRTVPAGGDLYLGSLYRRGTSGVRGTCRLLIRFQIPDRAVAGGPDARGADLPAELALARDLVEAMGGAFAIDASSRHSTAVSIDLPT